METSALIGLIAFISKKFLNSQDSKMATLTDQADVKQPNELSTKLYTQVSTSSTQTENFDEPKSNRSFPIGLSTTEVNMNKEMRNECIQKLKDKQIQILDHFQDDEIIELVQSKHIPVYKLESYFTNPTRGVQIR